MIYELINPSDPVTIEADDERVAIAATLLVGLDFYGLKREGRAVDVPLLAFVPTEEQEGALRLYCRRALGDELQSFVALHLEEVARCLESAVVGNATDRSAILAVVDEVGGDSRVRARALTRWNDRQRSSLNDICGRATALARTLMARDAADGPGRETPP